MDIGSHVKLRDLVFKEYIDNYDSFKLGTKFHMASRLFLWNQSPRAATWLSQIRLEWSKGEYKSSLESLKNKAATNSTRTRERNSLALRQPYLNKYPLLDHCNPILSKMHFLNTVYSEDLSEHFFTIFDKQEVCKLSNSLLNDSSALLTLSTYAINFLYFLHYDILKQELDIKKLLAIARQAPPNTDPEHIQLLIYYYTHCIIGETRFYYQTIGYENLPTYKQMFIECEKLIKNNFKSIHLDNKLEFLVCANILNMSTTLRAPIHQEVALSMSAEGSYLVDTVNKFPQKHRVTLEDSEHRNILYLLSSTPYSPIRID